MLFTQLDLGRNYLGINPLLKENKMQYVCIGADTETVDGDANCFQLSYDGKDADVHFCRATNVEQHFLGILDGFERARDRQFILWFHNIAFDLPVIFPKRHALFRNDDFTFNSHGWTITGVYSHLCFVTLRKGDLCVQLLGTDSYFKTSLAKLAEQFCPHLPKFKTPKLIGKKYYKEKDHAFVEYAKRDAVICQVVGSRILDMHAQYDIPISVSAPHMSSRIFRKKFVEHPIPLPSKSVLFSSLHSYHGGKNNFPVKRGLYKNVSCIDIKSAYPFAMSVLPSLSNRDLYLQFHPTFPIKNVPPFGIYKISGVAHLTPWPVIFGHGFKPLYGEFSEVWTTGFEVNQALRSGLVDITGCWGYYYDAARDKIASPFRAYVEHFFKLKTLAKEKGPHGFNKLLMNSLYGKFIETRGGASLLNIAYDIDKNTHEFSLEMKAGGLFNPFIATLITGHTRAYIHALELKFRAIHTSTDGIMTQEKFRGNSDALGGLSVEAFGDVLLLRNKLYIIYTRKKSLAAKDKFGKPLRSKIYPQWIQKYALHGFFADVHTLEKMVKTGGNEYHFIKVNKLRESLRRKLKVNRFQKQKRKLNLPEN